MVQFVFFFSMCIFTEANRDVLDWSGRKPLDYRKQSTSVSALTYSSKYGSDNYLSNNFVFSTAFSTTDGSIMNANGFANTLKIKRNKRFATMNGVMRSHSMRNFIKSSSPIIDTLTMPKRTTHFSPELNHESKRNSKNYRSILFRKKPNLSSATATTTKPNWTMTMKLI